MESQSASPEFQSGRSMENAPNLPTPESGHNKLPSPEAPLASPEQAKNAEQLSVDHQGAIVPVAQPPIAAATPVTDDQAQDATVVSAAPATARDEDIIEKEWISKVKSVISSTANDPYKQQSMMSRLMADYVLKRYGRKIGDVGE